MISYSISGLTVESEIELPGLIEGPAAAAEIVVRRGVVPERLSNPEIEGPTWQLAGREVLLTIPDVVRFLLIDGREIVYAPVDEATLPDVPTFVLGTAFGILLHQRRRIVLHASAVQVGDRVVLFCGRSGAGKSTLAAALSQRDYPLVTDDVCAITIEDGGVPLVHPDGRQLKLWAQAIDKLDLASERGEPVRSRLHKFYVEPNASLGAPLQLGAVYALREPRAPHGPGIVASNVVDATLLLRNNAYRPQLVRWLGQQPAYFHAATAIARVAGIFTLSRALDFAKMPDVVAMLEAHWADLRLREHAA